MRLLSLSLLLVVLFAIAIISWIINEIYGSANDNLQRQTAQQLAVSMATLPLELVKHHGGSDEQIMKLLDRDDLPGNWIGKFETESVLTVDNDGAQSYLSAIPGHTKYFLFTPPVADIQSTQVYSVLIFYGAIAATVLLWLAPLLRRLSILRAAARDIGMGKLQSRVCLGRFSYIREIETEFNAMAQRLQTLIEDNKMLSSAVSHDILTPLNRLYYATKLLKDTRPSPEQSAYHNNMSRDIDEMKRLVNTMVRFSELDHQLESAEKTDIDIDQLVSECISFFEVDAVDICKKSTLAANTTVYSNNDYLIMMINNLLQNAVKFSRSTVLVELFNTGGSVAITISDDGCGIPENQRDSVLRPFNKGDNSTLSDTSSATIDVADAKNITGYTARSGFGFGLSVVDRIVKWHKATLSIENCAELKGAKVRVLFPS